MIKHLTVNMPLAVPTQKRPPGKYASHPYPVLVDEDRLIVSIDVRDVVLREVLKQVYPGDALMPQITPLDCTKRNILRVAHVDFNETLSPTLTPLDIERIKPQKTVHKITIDDAVTADIAPLNITKKTVLIRYQHGSGDVMKPTIKPLDITLKKG